MSLTGAQIITEHLVREQVPYAVGLCGHGDLGLLDALVERQDEIKTISVHHESLAGFIADAYYRVAHQPLATFTSCGPGSANLPIALGSALMDDSAFLAITGNVATSQFNRGPFQESGRHFQADFPSVVRPYVKRSYQATRAEQLPLMLRQAFAQLRGGRPGPVHLDVPLDVFVDRTDEPVADPGEWGTGRPSAPAAGRAELDAACELIRDCARVVIVAGSGVEGSEAEAELLGFAREHGFPVATSPLGKSGFPASDPLSLGATGRNGTFQANHATRNADLVLAFGTRFDDRATSSWLPGYTYSFPQTRLVHVHIDEAELGRNFPPTVGIHASPREVLRQLRERLPEFASERAGQRRAWLDELAAAKAKWDEHTKPHDYSDTTPIRPERVLAELRDVLPSDGILLSDVGVHHNWIVQNWRTDSPRTLLQSWGFASMGFGVGGVLGAHLAAPDRPSVAVVGDGGFLMFPAAVATAVQYAIPAVWLVWNNGGFVSIRDQQKLYFGADRQLATTFEHAGSGQPYSADFAALSRSMGGEGLTVTDPADLGSALKTALDLRRPVVVDVHVDDAVGLPSAATWDLPPLSHPEPSFGWPDA
ncbi:acetolactate synthase-1/2/3 large subunit [Amycolatopsis pretoriensis]|uniref:Acetolactate synthase-1/2/3 large subunit n=1 Tax=Amycolatopsis pretoriensis TaxID=218821 RepID=A0A1H5R1R9_9PSEU|nr:thiamine pyrophosphate-binding protein [Amycolatopsis pretoriensis]SEF32275.1 acetolactate synthase-1/2/3 large subunit [Amycolatopsis pretoriensis]